MIRTAHAAVSIQKWVYGFQLIVQQTRPYQRWDLPCGMDERLHLGQGFKHLIHGRWYIGRVIHCAAGWPDPVLAAPELAGCQLPTADILHEARMDFPNETQAYRTRPHLFQPILQS